VLVILEVDLSSSDTSSSESSESSELSQPPDGLIKLYTTASVTPIKQITNSIGTPFKTAVVKGDEAIFGLVARLLITLEIGFIIIKPIPKAMNVPNNCPNIPFLLLKIKKINYLIT
jgi:hypothetical protein